MKLVVKMSVEDIEKKVAEGHKIKYVPLKVAEFFFGDIIYKDCGTHMYVSLDVTGDLENLPTLAHN